MMKGGGYVRGESACADGKDAGAQGSAWRRAVAPRLSEDAAQGTLEYALTVVALLAIVLALGALWRAGEDGTFVRLAERAASHGLGGTGLLDIALF